MCQTRHRTGEILSYGMLLLRLAHLTALLILVRLLPCRALFGCRFLYPVQVGLPEQLIGQSIFRFGQARSGVGSSAGQAPCYDCTYTTYSVRHDRDVPLRPVRALQLS